MLTSGLRFFFCYFLGVFIVAAKRTPFGTYGGVLKDHSATDLAEHAAKAALAAGAVAPELINSIIMGNVMQVGRLPLMRVLCSHNVTLCVSSEFGRCSVYRSSCRSEVWRSHPSSCAHCEQAVWLWFPVHHQWCSCKQDTTTKHRPAYSPSNTKPLSCLSPLRHLFSKLYSQFVQALEILENA